MKRKYTRRLKFIREKLAELIVGEMSVKDAAAALRVPRSTANYWRNELSLPKRTYRKSPK
jgi:hypothetical protein